MTRISGPMGKIRSRFLTLPSSMAGVLRTARSSNSWAKRKVRLGKPYVMVPDPTPLEVDRMVSPSSPAIDGVIDELRHHRHVVSGHSLGTKSMAANAGNHSQAARTSAQCDAAPTAESATMVITTRPSELYLPATSLPTSPGWFIYPLGSDFSYEPDPAKHKGTNWIGP